MMGKRGLWLGIAIAIAVGTFWGAYSLGVFTWLLTHWFRVLLSAYLLVAVVIAITGGRAIKAGLQRGDSMRDITIATSHQVQARDLSYYRTLVGTLLQAPSAIAFWPADVVFGIRMARQGHRFNGASSIQEFLVRYSTATRQAWYPTMTLVTAATLYWVGFARGEVDAFLRLGALALFLLVFLRHLGNAMLVDHLAVTLRRTSDSPLALYVLILSMDLSSLLLCDRLIVCGASGPGGINRTMLSESGRGLFQSTRVFELVGEGDFLGLFRVLAGAIFYLTLVKALLNLKEFRRDDADRLHRAKVFALLGKTREALKEARAITVPTGESEAVMAGILLSMGNVELAFERVRSGIEKLGEKPTTEDALVNLASLGAIQGVSPQTRVAIIEHGRNNKAADAAIQLALMSLCSDEPDQDLLESMERALSEDCPLARARLRALGKNWSRFEELLISATPGRDIDEISRLLMLLEARVMAADSYEDCLLAVEEWQEDSRADVVELVKGKLNRSELAIAHVALSHLMFLLREIPQVEDAALTQLEEGIESRLADSQYYAEEFRRREVTIEIVSARLKQLTES